MTITQQVLCRAMLAVLVCLGLQANLALPVYLAGLDQRVNRLLEAMASAVRKYVQFYVLFHRLLWVLHQ